jgi:hypothetical protein
MEITHGPVPAHAPDQPANVDVASGVAVRVTVLSAGNLASQVAPQEIPAGVETTVPVPLPASLTFSAGFRRKLARTDLAASIVTVQVPPAPAHAPDQPANVDVESGTAARVTVAPASKAALQTLPQSMPAGVDVTVPSPFPAFATLSSGFRLKTALTDFALFIVTVHVRLVPVQAPPQRVKEDEASGVAVSVTVVPTLKDALQAAPQSMPAGVELTVPPPFPVVATASAC